MVGSLIEPIDTMGTGLDFLNYLDHDMSLKIFKALDDPSDYVRASSVSCSWRHFVIANGLAKHLCLSMFPQLFRVDHVVEPDGMLKSTEEVGSSNVELETLMKEHRVYAFLSRGCTSFAEEEQCISEAIVASSTDNYPEESISNTLVKSDRVARRASYWSSKGHSNPAVPETLTYKLVADLCVITEIRIQPFQAYFQWGLPIYSAKSVRFRMGHRKTYIDDYMDDECCPDSVGDKYVWTYTSQEFPMAQENCLQNFKLPEPVLCIGEMLQIELRGRVQRQDMDGLFYICVTHVQVVGRPLTPAFGIEILEPSENFVLKALSYTYPTLPQESGEDSSVQGLDRGLMQFQQFVDLLRGNVVDVDILEYDWDGDDDDDDDDDDDELYEEEVL